MLQRNHWLRAARTALALGALVVAGSAWTALPAAAATASARRDDSTSHPTGFLFKTVTRNGQEYRYVLYVPADYDGKKHWPLIVFLNGAGECGRDGTKQIAVGLAPAVMIDSQKWPFLILFPQKPDVNHSWAENDDLVMKMLDVTKSAYKVDKTRTYLTGLSQGGFGTFAIGAKHADVFAAIAPICGGGSEDMAKALKNTPVRIFHGEADPTVPVSNSKDMLKLINDAGGNAKLTTYPGVGHNSWDKAYREENLADWFLAQKLEPAPK